MFFGTLVLAVYVHVHMCMYIIMEVSKHVCKFIQSSSSSSSSSSCMHDSTRTTTEQVDLIVHYKADKFLLMQFSQVGMRETGPKYTYKYMYAGKQDCGHRRTVALGFV